MRRLTHPPVHGPPAGSRDRGAALSSRPGGLGEHSLHLLEAERTVQRLFQEETQREAAVCQYLGFSRPYSVEDLHQALLQVFDFLLQPAVDS